MPAPHTLFVFALVAAAFVAVPGPSILYVLTRGLQSGSRAAVAGAAGCATGAYVYVAATAAGLAAGPRDRRPVPRARRLGRGHGRRLSLDSR
jgi:threonine/homoserine/homoserine lactone efflux protein